MRERWNLDLQIFGEGGGAAGGAGTGDAGNTSAVGTPAGEQDQILEDGTRVDRRLAERMEKQRARHPERAAGIANRQTGEPEPKGRADQAADQAQAKPAKTPEEEFDELIKGKYAKQYQQRMQNGISERFKNQADLKAEMDGLRPMLDALARQNGTPAGDWKALSDKILDDDSLYEDEADEKGMTVEGLKTFKKMEAQYNEMQRRQQESQEQEMFRAHLQKLAQQGDELKKVFPDFDLMRELNDPQFRRMTSPEGGLTVEQAYHALHFREIAPQAMAAGMQRAQRQIAQSIQANAARPMEGAASGNTQAADVHISPRNMTRAQREEIKQRARRGERIEL